MTDHIPTTLVERKLRIALMGEFSAGKSTLANLLLDRDASPVQVTATQLPPVWYRLGNEAARRVTASGDNVDMPMDDWSSANPDNTQLVQVQLETEFLHACDLIDMPGTSDPCMAPDFWAHFLPLVDLVIWCTPANQAWRQSEAALWEQVPEELRAKSLLLITRIDKMQSDHDRARVVARVKGEAASEFCDVVAIALPMAIAGRDDAAVLEQSGAADLVRFLEAALEHPVTDAKPDFVANILLTPPPPEPQCAVRVEDAERSPRQSRKVVPRRIVRGRAGGAVAP